MDVQNIKNYILENNKAEYILESLGCHHIKLHDGIDSNYYTFANPNGDNISAVTLYLSENLTVINYTRQISKNKNVGSDLFTLIEFYKDLNFFQSLKYVCDLLELDFYKDFNDDNMPESLRITKLLLSMNSGSSDDEEDNTPIQVIPEKILTYYKPYVNDFWKNDNVPYSVQQEWGLCYDEVSNRIIIPFYDELGNLVGCKGRLFKEKLDSEDLKYIYVEPCPRNKILYGLHKTYPYIKRENQVFCFEAEKSVHQLWSYGYHNAISFGGKKVGKFQIEKLTRLGCDIVLCFDQDVDKEDVERLADRFVNGVNVYCLYDKDKILKEHESPADKKENFEYLLKNNLYKIK